MGEIAKRIAMVSAPAFLIAFSVLHGTLEWSTTHALHGASVDEWVQHVSNIQYRWMAIHVAGIWLFPLLALTVWWMLPAGGVAASVSKAALGLYMPLYSAIDSLLGLGAYELIHLRQDLTTAEQPVLDRVFEALFFNSDLAGHLDYVASALWRIGVYAAAVALWRQWFVAVPLVVVGWPLGQSHFPPLGVIAGVALGLAVWQWLRLERRASFGPRA